MSVLKDVHDLLHTVSLSWGLFGNEGKKATQSEVEMRFAAVTISLMRELDLITRIKDPSFRLDPATVQLTANAELLFTELKEWLKSIDPDLSIHPN